MHLACQSTNAVSDILLFDEEGIKVFLIVENRFNDTDIHQG